MELSNTLGIGDDQVKVVASYDIQSGSFTLTCSGSKGFDMKIHPSSYDRLAEAAQPTPPRAPDILFLDGRLIVNRAPDGLTLVLPGATIDRSSDEGA